MPDGHPTVGENLSPMGNRESSSFPPNIEPVVNRPFVRKGLADWWDLFGVDHGFLRGTVWNNFHQVDAQLWRGNQPSPARIAWLAKKGVRTIINLRGPRDVGAWQLEAEACARHDITLVDFRLNSRDIPKAEQLHDLKDLFDAVTYPAFMHCKSGSDRAGIGAALYRLIHKGEPVRDALQELSLRYGHFRQAKTGMLDFFLESYIPFEDKNIDFFTFVDEHFDRDALRQQFTSHHWADRLVDGLLRRE